MPFIYDPTAGGSTSSTEWTRPPDWLTMPTVLSTDHKFVGLFAVYNHASNFVSLTASGNYTVDWGDGVVENVNSAVKRDHVYDYAAISDSTLCSRGYKQVLITVTPQAGQTFTSISLRQRHSQSGLQAYNTPWLDIVLAGTNLTSITFAGQGGTIGITLLERCRILSMGAVTTFAHLFDVCRSLQSIELPSTASVTAMNSMFGDCHSLQKIPTLNPTSLTDTSNMFRNCYLLKEVPLLNTGSATNMSAMFMGCQSITTIPQYNTASATNVSSMFSGCTALKTIPLLNTASATNMGSMFNLCYTLESIPALNTSSATTMPSFQNCTSLQTIPTLNASANTGTLVFAFQNCTSLSSAVLSGNKKAVSYINCKLSRQAIVDIFNALGTADGATTGDRTITVTGNWGAPSLTAGDLAIATAKNWTVAV